MYHVGFRNGSVHLCHSLLHIAFFISISEKVDDVQKLRPFIPGELSMFEILGENVKRSILQHYEMR